MSSAAAPLTRLLRSRLSQAYVFRFVLLWIAGKIANAVTSRALHLPPFGFRWGTELVMLAFELGVIVVFIKRNGEHILLGNLGWGLTVILAPLAVAHFVLSAAVALLAG